MSTDAKQLQGDDPTAFIEQIAKRADGHSPGYDIVIHARPSQWNALTKYVSDLRSALAAAQAAGADESGEVETAVLAVTSDGKFPKVSLSHSGSIDYWRELMRKALRAARALRSPSCASEDKAAGDPRRCFDQLSRANSFPPSASAPAGAPSEAEIARAWLGLYPGDDIAPWTLEKARRVLALLRQGS